MTWYVYVLECADATLYCGITTEPQRRLEQHNGQRIGGARYTRGRRPVVLRALCTCADHGSALRLEARLRSLPRIRKVPFLQALDCVVTSGAFKDSPM